MRSVQVTLVCTAMLCTQASAETPWRGTYIGFQAVSSANRIEADGRFERRDESPFGQSSVSAEYAAASNDRSIGAGIVLGTRYQWDRLTLGLQVDLDAPTRLGEVRGRASGTSVGGGGVVTHTGTAAQVIMMNWGASATARMGVTILPDVMVFGLAGVSFAQQSAEEPRLGINPSSCFCTFGTVTTNSWGPTVGGGIEIQIAANWSLNTEFRWTNLSAAGRSETSSYERGVDRGSGNSQVRVDSDIHSIRAGLSYQFR